jgi:phospholipid-translocating ATPase
MHNKTYMAAIGWIVSVGGWWIWTLALDAGIPPQSTKNMIPYPIKNNFLHGYGSDFQWWLGFFVILCSFIIFELAVSSIRKTWWPTETDTFQVLQKDPIIKRRFEETIINELEGKGSVEMGEEKRSSVEVQREGEIQELLDRPRVLGGAEKDERLAASEVHASRSASGTMTRRKFSVDGNGRSEADFESPRKVPKMRHSVDIAEFLGRR